MCSANLNQQPEGMPTETTQSEVTEQSKTGFVRSVGLLTAAAINMTQMCGIGPFITIPNYGSDVWRSTGNHRLD